MEDQRREKDNPFQPISLDERLSRPVPKTRHTAHEPMMMRPGQLYGRTPFYQPAVMGSPAPTEPAAPQTVPFSSFQPFGSVNASVAPMQPEPFASPSFRPVEEIQPAAPSEPSFQPLWQSPMEGSPAEKAVEESPSPEYIPESQRPVEKDALGVPKYLQRSPSLGEAQPRNWVSSVSTTAETTAPAVEWPSLDVPLWPMTKPVPLEEQSAPETNAAEENTPQSASESEMPVSATKPEKIAKVETSADAPGEAPLSNKAENTETVQSQPTQSSQPRRRSRMARRELEKASATGEGTPIPSEFAKAPTAPHVETGTVEESENSESTPEMAAETLLTAAPEKEEPAVASPATENGADSAAWGSPAETSAAASQTETPIVERPSPANGEPVRKTRFHGESVQPAEKPANETIPQETEPPVSVQPQTAGTPNDVPPLHAAELSMDERMPPAVPVFENQPQTAEASSDVQPLHEAAASMAESAPHVAAPVFETQPQGAETSAAMSAAQAAEESAFKPQNPAAEMPMMEPQPQSDNEFTAEDKPAPPAAEPLFSAAPCRAEKPVKEESTAAAAPAAGEDEWYKVFQQSGPLWDPAASPMGSELDAFFSDDAPKAEIHWNFNEDDPFVPSQEQPVAETPAPVFYPFEEDTLPPTEESPSKDGSVPLHGFDQPFVGGGLPPLGGRMEQPSADQPFFAAASDSEETSWNAGGQAVAPEMPFQPGQPYHSAPVENNGFYAGVESKKPESSRPAPHRPFAQKPAAAEKPKKSSKPPKEKPPKPPILWGRVAAIAAVAVMLLFCLIAGGKILMSLSANEREMAQVRQAYQEQQGQALEQAGVKVDLLPAGETFTPTSTPQVFAAPKAEAVQSGNGGETSADTVEEETIRTRLRRYPDNPLCNVLDSMKEISTEYPDVLARLYIPGVLDEYVVQRNNTYYLTHNYRGSLSDGGAVFLDRDCFISTPPENLLLRGEGNVAGVSFAPLWQYESGGIGFAAGACFAQLTTLYEDARYVLFSVIVADSDPAKPGYFDYASHDTFDTDAQMMEYVQSAADRSLYGFSVSVEPSDRLMTLATMSSRGNGKCLVLLFRMVREGEAVP